MGVSNQCNGLNITKSVISLNPTLKSLNLTTIDDVQVSEEDGSLKLGELDTENSISFLLYTQNPIKKKETNILYWSLPAKFLGSKLDFYNGKLSYKIVFKHLKPDEKLTYSPDLVLVSGNKEEVHYKKEEPFMNNKLTKMSIDIVEDSFTDAKGVPIRKDQLMKVLYDLNRVLIKASYTKDIVFTGIKEIEMTSASQIESCSCSREYKGRSCEKCNEGYFLKPSSVYHQCIPCDCNGNSNKCDPQTGRCLECEYNFEGDRCDKCKDGYYLSRTRGFMECIPISLTNTLSYSNSSNICNDGVEGYECNRCKAGFYNLKNAECTKCSCSGVTEKCRENFGYLSEVKTTGNNIQLKDRNSNRVFTLNEIRYSHSEQKYTFDRFDLVRDRTLFWELPIEFLNNKIRSYGYNLSYQIDIESNEPEDTMMLEDSDVEIISKKMRIIYTAGSSNSSRHRQMNVPLKEQYWEKIDIRAKKVQPITKLEFLEVLNNIEDILVRAVYHEKQQSASISKIQLTTVNDQQSNRNEEKTQTNIEQCICPIGYESTSCERCSPGYTKNEEGLCVRCQCNGHANECIILNKQQKCVDCLHNTMGEHCDKCRPGFYGDASLKTPTACKPCPCPTIRASGNFASTCRQEIDTGEIICNCQEG